MNNLETYKAIPLNGSNKQGQSGQSILPDAVLSLPLNEIVDGKVIDQSANKLSCVVQGAALVPDDTFGQCLSFDGVDDYINVANIRGFVNQNHTMTAWIYIEKYPSNRAWPLLLGQPGTGSHHWLLHPDGTIRVGVWAGNQYQSPAVGKQRWTHIATTYIDGTLSTYIDGVLQQTITASFSFNVNDISLWISHGVANENYFDGKLAHVKIYNTALSAAQIQEVSLIVVDDPRQSGHSVLPDAVLSLPLNEIVDGKVIDQSTNKLSCVVQGATLVPDDTFGQCLSFDGVNDKITLNTPLTMITDQITISFWAWGSDALPKQTSVLSACNSVSPGDRIVNIHLPWDNNTVYFDCGLDQSGNFDRTAKAANTRDYKGQWNHWALTKNATTGMMAIYLNGQLWHSQSEQRKTISNIDRLFIGSYLDGSYPWPGKLAHVKIYNTALSAAQIREISLIVVDDPRFGRCTSLANGKPLALGDAQSNGLSGDDFSASVWVKRRDSAATLRFLDDSGWQCLANGKLRLGKNQDSTAVLALKQWQHLCWIQQGQRQQLYLNGQPVASLADGAGIAPDQALIYQCDGGTFHIAHQHFYQRALTIPDVVADMQANAPAVSESFMQVYPFDANIINLEDGA